MKNEKEAKYKLYCLNCHNTRYSNGNDIDDLVEIPLSKIFTNIAFLDKNNKVKNSEPIERRRKIKCKECGHVYKVSEIPKETKNEQTNSAD